MDSKDTKKQMKIKQKDYMMLINTPKDVEKWLGDQNKQRTQNSSKISERERKSNGVGMEYSKGPKHQYEDVDGSFINQERQETAQVNDGKGKKEKAGMVKQKDLLKDLNEQQAKTRKSSKKKRDVFIDEFGTLEGRRKKNMTLNNSIEKKASFEVKRYQSPWPTSSPQQKRHASSKERSSFHDNVHSQRELRRRERCRQISAENPADLGQWIHNKLTSLKQSSNNETPAMVVKQKVPFSTGNSKKYELSKRHKSIANYEKPQSKTERNKKHQNKDIEIGNDEIYISLNPRTPQEKRKIMKEQEQEIIDEFLDATDISDRKLSVDGTWSKNEQETLGYSELDHKDEMLF